MKETKVVIPNELLSELKKQCSKFEVNRTAMLHIAIQVGETFVKESDIENYKPLVAKDKKLTSMVICPKALKIIDDLASKYGLHRRDACVLIMNVGLKRFKRPQLKQLIAFA